LIGFQRDKASVVKPPNFRDLSKPNKANHLERKKIGPTLPRITPQKRTMKEVIGKLHAGCHPRNRPGLHPALPAPNAEKVHKSAQNTPGNHPPTQIASTTYEAFPAKNTPAPLSRQRRG
jgi:hypothetical protein